MPARLTSLGPDGTIPLDRAQNQIRLAAQIRRTSGAHDYSLGLGLTRRQVNGEETDVPGVPSVDPAEADGDSSDQPPDPS